MRKESKYNIKGKHQNTRGERRRKNREEIQKQSENNKINKCINKTFMKMDHIWQSKYIMAEWTERPRPIHVLCITDSLQKWVRDDWNEGMEKYTQVYEDAKKAEVAITHIRQNKF